MVDTKGATPIQGGTGTKQGPFRVIAAMQTPVSGDGYLPLDAILFAVTKGQNMPLQVVGRSPFHYFRASFAITTWTPRGALLWAPTITWYGVGDIDGVRSILTPIRAIGGGRKRGLGQVYRWTVEPVTVDRSVVDDGRLRRAIPAHGPECPFARALLAMRGLRPPYYDERERMPVWLPELDIIYPEAGNV